MAKQPRRQPADSFFESLAASASSSWEQLRQPTHPSIQRSWEVAQLVGQDLWRYTRRTGRYLFKRQAIKLYLVTTVVVAMTAGVGAALVASATYAAYDGDMASPSTLLNKKNTGTTIVDRHGEVLYQVYGANNRQLVELSQLPPELIKATLAAEDPNFYSHPGFSWRATTRAALQNLSNGEKIQGGSTITQQLVKNALLSPDKSYTRKFQEILLSLELERRYSKDEILQMYLNEVYYGQGSFGIESAAQTFFHKPASQLSLADSALLAGLPLGPSRFDPNADPEAALGRRNYVLDRMQQLGFVSAEQVTSAKNQPLTAFARQIDIKAPHFVFYILNQLSQLYGEELVERGGITVTTSLDLTKQTAAETTVREGVSKLRQNGASNGSLVALDPTNGEILAMVGSIDYYEPNFGRVNVALTEQQPGSAFKPIAYTAAFNKGWNGATKVDDKPMTLTGGDGKPYKPRNYDGKFRGPVLLRRALANSLNIPAIEVIRHAGVADTLQLARSMGITTLTDPSRYGVSLVLGGGDVRPLDMATAYGVLANNGTLVPTTGITKVVDRNGKDITKPSEDRPHTVVDPRIAFMINDILSDNSARSEIFGTVAAMRLPFPAAVKTGTTNDYRDNWTVGYTPNLVTVVWVGNNDNRPMDALSGSIGAAPIWNRFMLQALSNQPVPKFSQPPGVVKLTVCSQDGGLANPWDTPVNEWFLVENRPGRQCASQAPKPPEETTSEADKEPDDNSVEPDKPDEPDEPEVLPRRRPRE